MKKVIPVLFILIFPFGLIAQIKMPAATIGAREVIKKDLLKHENFLSEDILNRFPIQRKNGQYHIALLCKLNNGYDKSDLLEKGWDVGSVIRDIASVRIPLHSFLTDFSDPSIAYMEVSERFDSWLDQAVTDVHADSVHNGINLPQPYTGKNVLVGIVDWGFEYVHPVFYDTSLTKYRVIAAWDQAKTGVPPQGFSYGTEYADSASLHLAQADTFSFVSDYHGTHVAGIAGGAGAGTVYRGLGFESDLLFTQMNGHASYSLDAYQWMFNKANALGKRLVINNSFGSYRTNPLDGTSLFSQAMDAYADSGVVFVVSAGNNGSTGFHIKKTFNMDSIRTRIAGFSYASDQDLWGQTISMWGEQGNDFSVKMRILNSSGQQILITPTFNTGTAQPFIDTFMVYGADTVFYMLTTDAVHPLNNRPQMSLDVKCENTGFKVILISASNTGTVHYWNTRRTIFGGGNWGYGFTTYGSGYTSGDSYYSIGHPSVTTNVISVAAHTSGAGAAGFSSYGPRMDEYPKPDVSAPGVNVVSSLNSFAAGSFSPVATVNFNSKNYDFIPLSGTSMAGPVVTGIVSLMLEAKPDITPAQVKYILRETARADAFTGVITAPGDTKWGMGKVNAYQAVQLSFTASVEESRANTQYSVFPNPSNGQLMISGNLTGTETIAVFSLDGKLLVNEKMNSSLDISDFTSGIYLLQISNDGKNEIFRLVIH